MSEHRQVVKSSYKFTWEIEKFLIHIENSKISLNSLKFSVKCIYISTWFVEIIPVCTGNDWNVLCCLFRLEEQDELDTFIVDLTTMVENEKGDIIFQKYMPSLRMKKNASEIYIENIIDSTRYLKTLDCFGSLFLHFNLDISVEPITAYNFNFSPELQSLSNDFSDLYENEALREATIYIGDNLFFAHLFMLHARWPNFSKYCSMYPRLVSINDQSLYNIHFDIFTSVAIKRNLNDTISKREALKILTPEMFEYLLHYVYTGKIRDIEENKKPNFIRLCRLFDFERLVYKYADIPIASTCFSRAPICRYILDWSQEDGKHWERNNFEPFVQAIDSQKGKFSVIELEFTIKENDFIINVGYLEASAVVLMTCVVILKNNDGLENKTVFHSRVPNNDELCPVPVGITKDEIPFKSFTFEVAFYCRFESKITKNTFSLATEDAPLSQALHQYRCDFRELLESKKKSDVALITEGKVFNVHKYILCARSTQLYNEMKEKMRRTHTIIHMVPGVKYHVLEKILECIYTGVVDKEAIEDMEGFLRAATRFHLRHLIKES